MVRIQLHQVVVGCVWSLGKEKSILSHFPDSTYSGVNLDVNCSHPGGADCAILVGMG